MLEFTGDYSPDFYGLLVEKCVPNCVEKDIIIPSAGIQVTGFY